MLKRALQIQMLWVLAFVCSCHGNGTKAKAQTASPASRDTISLPQGSSPTGVFTTSSSTLVVKTGDILPGDNFHRSVYSWEPGQPPKLIIGAHALELTRLSENEFAALYSEKQKQALVTLNSNEVTSQPLVLPRGGPSGWGLCEGDARYLACTGDVPGISVDDEDYDEMAFTAVLVIDLEHRTTSWFPVKHGTYFHFDSKAERLYVSDLDGPEMNSPVKTYDLRGHQLGSTQVWNVALSPSGRFAESLQQEGGESWVIYERKTKQRLLAFNCDKPECKIGERPVNSDNLWNPVFDGQIVVQTEGGAYGKGDTCDIYQSAPPRLLKRIPCDGLPVLDWSRDGRDLITIQYLGGKYHRERVN